MKIRIEKQDVLETIDNIQSAQSVDSALKYFSQYIGRYGFSSYLIGEMANPASQTKKDLLTNWSPEWLSRWVDKNYVFHDPIFQYALRSREPFLWSDAYDRSSKAGKRIMSESKGFGLEDGIAIPIATDFGPLGCVSLATNKVDLPKEDLPSIELVCIHLYQHLQNIEEKPSPDIFGCLTKRETEVLHFVAEGKTNWEIGKILELSEFSIKDHVRNLTLKLCASNRTHAVSVAIRNGLIIP